MKIIKISIFVAYIRQWHDEEKQKNKKNKNMSERV